MKMTAVQMSSFPCCWPERREELIRRILETLQRTKDLLHEHADEGADGGREAHRERVVVDALAAALRGDHRRDDRARRRRGDAVADAVEAAHEEEQRERVDGEVEERRREVEEDARVEHALAAVELDGASREDAREQCAEDEDARREAGFAHGRVQRADGLGGDDDHEHVVDDVDEEIDQGIEQEPLGPQAWFLSRVCHFLNQRPF